MVSRITQIALVLSLGLLQFGCADKNAANRNAKQDFYKKKISENKIRFEKVFEYEYRFGQPDTSNGFLVEVLEYDTSGNILKRQTFHKEDFMKKYDESADYKYDSEGNNTEIIRRNSVGEITSITKNIFSKDGLNTERIFYNSDGSLEGKVIYKYGNNSNVKEQISYEGNGKFEYKTKYTYNNKGEEISSTRFNDEGKIIEKYLETSNSISLKTYEFYDTTNKIKWKSTDKLDAKGNVVEQKTMDMESNEETRTEYKYDRNDLLVEIIKIESHGEPRSLKKVIREKF